MLLSSGHPLSEASADLPRIVEDLAARNVACLAVRRGAYDFEFSREMRAAADERGLPLVSLADEFAFDDILIDVLGTINLALRREVDFVENIHTATTEMLIEGASLDGLSRKVSEFLGAEVAVFDPRGQRVAAWPPKGDTPAWEDLEATAAVLGAVGWPTRTIRLRLGTDAAPLGYLHMHRDDLAFGPTEVQAAEQVSNVVTLALAQRSAIRSVEVNFEREVVARVLRGEIEDPGEVTQRLASVGWDHPGPVVVAVVRVTTLGEA